MTLATYGELETTVGQYLRRTDRGAQIQNWVRLVELEAGRELRLRAQQQVVTGTLASGSDTLETPVGILYPQQLVFAGQPPISIDTVPFAEGQQTAFVEAGRATPTQATVWGVTSDYKTQVRVWPTPAGNADYTLYYTTGIAALTSSATTNYLLLVAPDLYLYGCLFHGAMFDHDAEGAVGWRGPYDNAMGQVRKIEWRARATAGRLRLRARGATP